MGTEPVGVRIPPSDAWDLLAKDTVRWDWAGTSVPALALPARAMHLALHCGLSHAYRPVGFTIVRSTDEQVLARKRIVWDNDHQPTNGEAAKVPPRTA